MARIRPLSWQAALAVLVLSIGTLGDTCPTRGPAAGSQKLAPAPSASAANPAAAAPAPTAPPQATPPSALTFEATVRPILAAKCAPCHNPGGKMYGRLPFDQPGVVSSHADGVRRRLKGEDLQALEKWLATLPPAPAGGEKWADKPDG
jgi:hypothetical protein